jgi:hypothetical protein
MSRTHDVTISAFDLDRLESELTAVTEQRDRLAEAINVSLARAYASGYMHGHEATVEGQFTPLMCSDYKDFFKEDVRQMHIDECFPELMKALAAVKEVSHEQDQPTRTNYESM